MALVHKGDVSGKRQARLDVNREIAGIGPKVDGRTKRARRLRELSKLADDPATQLDQLRRRYAVLCLTAEKQEALAKAGEPYDAALLCNITGQLQRTADRIADLLKPEAEPKPKPYWEPTFHEMSDADFEKWIADRGITSDRCATEVRAREAYRAQLAALTPEQRAELEEMMRRSYDPAFHAEREGVRNALLDSKNKKTEDRGRGDIDIYLSCNVPL